MLYGLLVVLYVIVSVFLVLVVLLQTGKRADLAGAFGGGGSQTAFGARGAANFLTKMTTVSAVLFMVLALTLALMSSRNASSTKSVLDELEQGTDASAPAPAPTEGLPALPVDAPADDADAAAETDPPEEPSIPDGGETP